MSENDSTNREAERVLERLRPTIDQYRDSHEAVGCAIYDACEELRGKPAERQELRRLCQMTKAEFDGWYNFGKVLRTGAP